MMHDPVSLIFLLDSLVYHGAKEIGKAPHQVEAAGTTELLNRLVSRIPSCFNFFVSHDLLVALSFCVLSKI